MEDDGLMKMQMSKTNISDIARKKEFTSKVEKAIKRHKIRQDRHGISMAKRVEPFTQVNPKLKN